jgi:hypothetical protein
MSVLCVFLLCTSLQRLWVVQGVALMSLCEFSWFPDCLLQRRFFHQAVLGVCSHEHVGSLCFALLATAGSFTEAVSGVSALMSMCQFSLFSALQRWIFLQAVGVTALMSIGCLSVLSSLQLCCQADLGVVLSWYQSSLLSALSCWQDVS